MLELVASSIVHPDDRPAVRLEETHVGPQHVASCPDARVELEVFGCKSGELDVAMGKEGWDVVRPRFGASRVQSREAPVELLSSECRVARVTVQRVRATEYASARSKGARGLSRTHSSDEERM